LLIPQPLRALLAKFPIHSSSETRHKFAQATRDPIQRFILLLEVSSVIELQPLLKFRPTTPLQDLWKDQYGQRCQGLHPFDQFVLLESETRLVNFINLYDDRLSMAHSVESRPAFLDHHLWEFCARLSPETKLSTDGNKYLLRLGMKDRLPAELVGRPKKGLSAPYSGWWRAGELPNWVEEIMHPSMLAQSGYFDVGEVVRLRQRHESNQANLIRELTSILTTQLWHFEVLQNR
jgi:asparagine synthetase B (glutamine-hydrolysing)